MYISVGTRNIFPSFFRTVEKRNGKILCICIKIFHSTSQKQQSQITTINVTIVDDMMILIDFYLV